MSEEIVQSFLEDYMTHLEEEMWTLGVVAASSGIDLMKIQKQKLLHLEAFFHRLTAKSFEFLKNKAFEMALEKTYEHLTSEGAELLTLQGFQQLGAQFLQTLSRIPFDQLSNPLCILLVSGILKNQTALEFTLETSKKFIKLFVPEETDPVLTKFQRYFQPPQTIYPPITKVTNIFFKEHSIDFTRNQPGRYESWCGSWNVRQFRWSTRFAHKGGIPITYFAERFAALSYCLIFNMRKSILDTSSNECWITVLDNYERYDDWREWWAETFK